MGHVASDPTRIFSAVEVVWLKHILQLARALEEPANIVHKARRRVI